MEMHWQRVTNSTLSKHTCKWKIYDRERVKQKWEGGGGFIVQPEAVIDMA